MLKAGKGAGPAPFVLEKIQKAHGGHTTVARMGIGVIELND